MSFGPPPNTSKSQRETWLKQKLEREAKKSSNTERRTIEVLNGQRSSRSITDGRPNTSRQPSRGRQLSSHGPRKPASARQPSTGRQQASQVAQNGRSNWVKESSLPPQSTQVNGHKKVTYEAKYRDFQASEVNKRTISPTDEGADRYNYTTDEDYTDRLNAARWDYRPPPRFKDTTPRTPMAHSSQAYAAAKEEVTETARRSAQYAEQHRRYSNNASANSTDASYSLRSKPSSYRHAHGSQDPFMDYAEDFRSDDGYEDDETNKRCCAIDICTVQ
uniref:Uncharacterized protein n=1 Tax=Eutreptiella gymnastica TaxID=73025 RepID=A0A7S1J234_9EUGL|mmetsp:Transcript_60603/g.108096  ORF Transcript_60603/g.108096 Transcript_60603/m.108096 type:complete len:275 (+) Transcript_60603:74-898(+)